MNHKQVHVNDFKPGIYLHYKNHLYEADHLTHNSSENNRIEIHYIGLQLSGANEGPRHATREFNEFLVDRVHKDGSKCSSGSVQGMCQSNQHITKRFRYLGPVFEAWMLKSDVWEPSNRDIAHPLQ